MKVDKLLSVNEHFFSGVSSWAQNKLLLSYLVVTSTSQVLHVQQTFLRVIITPLVWRLTPPRIFGPIFALV